MSTRTTARPSSRRDRSSTSASTSGSSGTETRYCGNPHPRPSFDPTCALTGPDRSSPWQPEWQSPCSLRRRTAPTRAAPLPAAPAYVARDLQNMQDAYGRITGPGGQLQNPAYLESLVAAGTADQTSQLLEQAASPTRIAVTPGRVVPGWNVGNPLRAGWNGTRGQSERISFTNRYGALLNGTVYRPKPGARDPYTGEVLRGPVPGRGDHRGLGAGQRGHVPLARPGPRRARLRRAHLRRAGPGRRRDAPPRTRPRQRTATRCRSATRSRRRRTASSSAAPASRSSSCPTSWSAPRTRCRSSPRPRRSTTPTRARRARR